MAEIVWVNGQGEFDFDYLLNLTNEEFTNRVSSFVDRNSDDLKEIKVIDSPYSVVFLLVCEHSLVVYNFSKSNGYTDFGVVPKSELRWALEVMQRD